MGEGLTDRSHVLPYGNPRLPSPDGETEIEGPTLGQGESWERASGLGRKRDLPRRSELGWGGLVWGNSPGHSWVTSHRCQELQAAEW